MSSNNLHVSRTIADKNVIYTKTQCTAIINYVWNYFVSGRCARYCDQHVCISVCLSAFCMSVCLSARISQKPYVRISRVFVHVTRGAIENTGAENDGLKWVHRLAIIFWSTENTLHLLWWCSSVNNQPFYFHILIKNMHTKAHSWSQMRCADNK